MQHIERPARPGGFEFVCRIQCYDAIGLKLEGATFRRVILRVAAAAAAFSASCFAKRRAALLFVLGAMDGLAQTLLGRGLRAGASDELSAVFGLEPLVGFGAGKGRAAADDGRGAARRDGGEACGAGAGNCGGSVELVELCELVLETPGSFGAEAPRTGRVISIHVIVVIRGNLHMNEVGGASGFWARREALLFSLGAIVGAFDDATAMDSRRLWPGTPSKVLFATSAELIDLLLICGSGCIPSRSDAARVMRGAIVGAAVEATAMTPARLWPGTLANVLTSCSFVGGVLGAEGTLVTMSPARKAALRVVRGMLSGLTVEAGTGRARKAGLPFALGLPLLPAVEVALEAA
jgi:hypothetical protein